MDEQAQKQPKQKPVKVFRAGRGLRVAIWRNEVQVRDRTVARHSVKLEKRYCDDKGVWQDSDYLFDDELPRVGLLLRKAFEFIVLTEDDNDDDVSSAAE